MNLLLLDHSFLSIRFVQIELSNTITSACRPGEYHERVSRTSQTALADST